MPPANLAGKTDRCWLLGELYTTGNMLVEKALITQKCLSLLKNFFFQSAELWMVCSKYSLCGGSGRPFAPSSPSQKAQSFYEFIMAPPSGHCNVASV